jgi:hypothetical protein
VFHKHGKSILNCGPNFLLIDYCLSLKSIRNSLIQCVFCIHVTSPRHGASSVWGCILHPCYVATARGVLSLRMYSASMLRRHGTGRPQFADVFYIHVTSPRHGASSVCECSKELQIWRVAANTLNKKSRTANKGWFSNFELECGANNSSL